MSLDTVLPTGSKFLDYRIEKVLGRGGMGVVYLAEDMRLRRQVALKLLPPQLAGDALLGEQLLLESRLAAAIDHPNIVPIYESGDFEGRIFISMRYVSGSSLQTHLRNGHLPVADLVELVSQIAAALDAAHARGLIHGDVKPSNVLIAPRAGRDGGDHVYLADFGLSRLFDEGGAAPDRSYLAGTLDYVAPERIRDETVDGRADVYSLGCLLFECLTGEPPFRGRSDVALLFAHLEEDPPSISSLRPDLAASIDHVCARALAKSPSDRPETCRALVEEARVALGLAGSAHRDRRRIATIAATAAAIGAIAVGFAVAQHGAKSARPEGAGELVQIDTRSDRVARRASIAGDATAVAAGRHYVWVTNVAGDTVTRVDVRTGSVVTLPSPAPTGIAVGAQVVAVVGGPAHRLAVLDAATGDPGYAVRLPGGGTGDVLVASGPGGIWFADPAQGIVAKVDNLLTAGTTSAQVAIPRDTTSFTSGYEAFDGLAVAHGAVWVTGDPFERVLWRVDLRTRVVRATRLPFIPGEVATYGRGVWVTSLLGDTVSRIVASTGRISTTVHIGHAISGIAATADAVWITSGSDRTIRRLDRRSLRVTRTIHVPGPPGAIAAGASGVWATIEPSPTPVPISAIGIGIVSDCRGTYGSYFADTLAAVQLPLIEQGGKRAGAQLTDGVAGVSIGGRPIDLRFGCTDGTAASALTEARRLVVQEGAKIVIGPVTGAEGRALQTYARRRPDVTFLNGSSSAQQLHPAPNFFSFWADGAQWTAGVGAYAFHKLGWRTAVTIANADDFDWAQAAGFDAEFCSLGGKIVSRIWLAPNSQDFSTLLRRLPKGRVDGFFVESPGTGALEALASSDSVPGGNLAGRVAIGTTVAFPPSLVARMRGVVFAGQGTPPATYVAALRTAFPEVRHDYLGSAFDYAYYDAMAATLRALKTTRGNLPGGQRAFRAALVHMTLDAPNGQTTLGRDHQAIAPTDLERILGAPGQNALLATIQRVDHTFGGYFTASDPPPGPSTPGCHRARPPAWAR